MAPSTNSVLEIVERRAVPGPDDRKRMDSQAANLKKELQSILISNDFDAEVSIQGSVAKDTWLRGEADLDIFAGFEPSMNRTEWVEKVIPALKKGLSRFKIVERYAEHPYLEFRSERVRVNVVPYFVVKKGEWKSATDRTPFHTEYMNSHLTPKTRAEVRFLKRFMKGIDVYGAEIRVGGFSGMLAETLVLNYGSFTETLEEASCWNGKVRILVEKLEGAESADRFDSSLVVIDPIDPERNLAAAVRSEKLWSFVAASRQLLQGPSLEYFYPRTPRTHSKSEFQRKLKDSEGFLAIVFPHPKVVVDILWGQLLSLEQSLVGLLQRFDFRIARSHTWSDDRKLGVVFLELETPELPRTRVHLGPPVARREESQTFLERHRNSKSTLRGPYVQSERWIVEKRREYPSSSELLRKAFKDSSLGLSVPKQLHNNFTSGAHIVDRDGIEKMISNRSFAEALWDFLDGRPRWLRLKYA
ncbi:MAG: CCA-adding enzyme [Crenarchaeota archaeon 13_1_40CM_3_53_5]|nr:MAG: CCA-adding enzyme [Crenarchaeota archaeon 13_1_40CM_3_53_5]